jgi:aldose 1-epimerase
VSTNLPLEQLNISRVTESGLSIAGFSALGASCTNLSLSGRNLISPEIENNPSKIFFGSVLAPWPNRLQDGWFELEGRRFEFASLDPQSNALHGLIGYEPIEVREHLESEITFGHRFGNDEYPFEVDLEIRYSIGDSFVFEANAQNLGSQTAPFALGFHPYYRLKGQSRMRSNVSKHAITDWRLIPSSVEDIAPLDFVFPGDVKLDSGFSGDWRVQFETEEFSVEITQVNMPHLMLYTPPTSPFADGTPSLAIEPMSGPTNAFQTEIEKHLLAPGETRSYRYEVRSLN